jgi:hypothetical protein
MAIQGGYSKYTKALLEDELRSRGLSDDGTKDQLIERLKADDADRVSDRYLDLYREELRSRGLPDNGTKDELIERLEEDEAHRDSDEYPGRVRIVDPADPATHRLPLSSLVTAFKGPDRRAFQAIVLRGYLGRSDTPQRTIEYLDRAKGFADGGDLDAIETLRAGIERFQRDGEEHVPWRLYLTPGLDRYVEFHISSVLAYRREPKTERRDASTVWLRLFEEGNPTPIPYEVVHVSILGPSFASWVGGVLVDDYLDQPGSGSSAWGDQSSVFGGGRPRTGVYCGGRPRTGVYCGE